MKETCGAPILSSKNGKLVSISFYRKDNDNESIDIKLSVLVERIIENELYLWPIRGEDT